MEIRRWVFLAATVFTVLFTAIVPAFSQPPVNERDAQGNTPLHLAAQANYGRNGDEVDRLIAAGADVNATNFAGQTPAHLAIIGELTPFKGSVTGFESLPKLLKAGANVNVQDRDGMTPLLLVASSDSVFRQGMFQALMEAGADPNVRDKQGRTILHLLLSGEWPWHGASEMLPLLAAARVDFSAKDNDGKTPLHYLAAMGGPAKDPLFTIQNLGPMLAVAKADVSARDNRGDTPLHIAARLGNRDIYNWLVQHGASVDATNNAGETPKLLAGPQAPFRFNADIDIYQAAVEGNLERVKEVLKSNPALLNQTNRFGETPLCMAAEANRSFVVDFLVKAGAQWDEVSATAGNRGDELKALLARTPSLATNGQLLHVAAMHNADVAAQVLIAAGADLAAPDKFGCSPLGVAQLGHHQTVAAVFQQHGAQENIFDAAYLGDFDAALALLAADKSLLMATNGAGLGLVTVAAASGHDELLGMLLSKGAPLSSEGTTPLHAAVSFNRTNAVETLLEHGEVADAFDSRGLTPLQLAVMNGSFGIANALLKHRGSMGAANPDTPVSLPVELSPSAPRSPTMSQNRIVGDAALHFAAMNADTNMIQLLLRSGASANITNQDNETPLDVASEPRMGPPLNFFSMVQNQQIFGPVPVLHPIFSRPPFEFERRAAAKMLEDAGASHGQGYHPFGAPRFHGGGAF